MHPAEKDLLQTAAVIGRQFTLAILSRIAGKSSDQLEQVLTSLQSGEFIYEQPSFSEVDYMFKHPLTQEVAYGSILIERRRALHERAAEAIEAYYGGRLEDHYGDLAHHYERAGNAAKAVDYLLVAGQQAGARSAYTQELEYLTRARTLLGELPPGADRSRREYDLMRAMGFALIALRGHGARELEPVYPRLQELCAELRDEAGLARALSGMQLFYTMRLDLARAREIGERAVDLAERAADAFAVGQANFGLAQTLFFMGRYKASLTRYEKAIAAQVQVGSARALSLVFSGLALWMLGYPEQALERCEQGRFSSVGLQAATRGWALIGICFLHQLRSAPREVLQTSEAASALAAEYGGVQVEIFGAIQRGWALGMLGNVEEGIAELRRGPAARAQIGMATRPNYLLMLAELYVQGGHHRESLEAIDEAIAVIEKTEDRCYEAPILALKGEVILAMNGSADEARDLFEKAIEVARAQEAKSWELRATTSLARLLAKQGHREETRTMLAEIYGWFTEGFDTADLKGAKALLDHLVD